MGEYQSDSKTKIALHVSSPFENDTPFAGSVLEQAATHPGKWQQSLLSLPEAIDLPLLVARDLTQHSPLIAETLSLRHLSQFIGDEQKDILTGNAPDAPLVQPDDATDLISDRTSKQENNNQSEQRKAIKATLAEAITSVKAQLKPFADDPLLTAKLREAFGDQWDIEEAQSLLDQLSSDDHAKFPDMRLKLLPVNQLGAQSAFAASTNTIYVFEDFLSQHLNDPETIATVLLEEIGHYIDAQFLRELVAFGFEYAKLNPASVTIPSDEAARIFLGTLWQAPSGTEMVSRQGTAGLGYIFEAADTQEKRLRLLKFETNLLQAMKLIPSLQDSMKDPFFIDGMITLGSYYATLEFVEGEHDPVHLLSDIWKAQNQQELEVAAENFQNLLNLANLDDSANADIGFVVAQNVLDELRQRARQRFGGDPTVYSGLWPWQERGDSYHEAQRDWALGVISRNAEYIIQVADYYGFTAHAIVGAILWEALENPYDLVGRGGTGFLRPGEPLDFGIPGKIHIDNDPDNIATDPEVEDRVRQRRPDATIPTTETSSSVAMYLRETQLLDDETLAIDYIGAIFAEHIEDWESTSRTAIAELYEGAEDAPDVYDISDQAGLLGAMYQGLNPIDGARSFENRRHDYFELTEEERQGKPTPQPQLPREDATGPWISQYRWWIARYLEFYGHRQDSFSGSGEIPVPQESFEPRAEYDIWNDP